MVSIKWLDKLGESPPVRKLSFYDMIIHRLFVLRLCSTWSNYRTGLLVDWDYLVTVVVIAVLVGVVRLVVTVVWLVVAVMRLVDYRMRVVAVTPWILFKSTIALKSLVYIFYETCQVVVVVVLADVLNMVPCDDQMIRDAWLSIIGWINWLLFWLTEMINTFYRHMTLYDHA